jgi:hypothetical protein
MTNEYERQYREHPQVRTRNGATNITSAGYKSKRQIDRERKRAGKPTYEQAQAAYLTTLLGEPATEQP